MRTLAAPPPTPPQPALPETRLRVSAVLSWPRYRPSLGDVADSIRENSQPYDGLASGSIYFLSRDPAIASTLQPYGYVHGNPLNSSDPSGLDGCGWNPVCYVGTAASSVWNWASTPTSVLNSRFVSGSINAFFGAYKIGTGIFFVTVGTAADLTGIGALIGVPAQTYGVYQLVTGVGHIVRGTRQFIDALGHPLECKSPLQYGADIALDLLPGGGGVENLIGGLP